MASECASCGNIFMEDANFCRKCGARRGVAPAAYVPQAPLSSSGAPASGFQFERRRLDATPPLPPSRDSPEDAASSSAAAGLDQAAAAATATPHQEPVTSDASALRPRSASPWRFQMNAKALGRLRPEAAGGGGTSGMVTPTFSQSGGKPTSGTRTASVVQAAARASYESALLSAVRRQIEAFEEKVGSQMERIQNQTDRTREAQLCRLEEKVTAAEGQQPKLDRRLAELGGNYKGLSDEMQSQIRRVDLMDDRLWEWRHQMEEELRSKYGDFEQNVQKVASSFRIMQSSIEDGQKRQQQRIQRLEEEVAARISNQEEVHQGFANVCARLEALENRLEEESQLLANTSAMAAADTPPSLTQPQEELSVVRSLDDGLVSTSLYDLLSKRLEDLSSKVDSSLQDGHDIHAGMALQEEQLRTLRTMFEAREEHLRALAERVDRGDWAANLKQIREAIHEDGKQRQLQAETSQVLSKKVEYLEQAHEQLLSTHDQLTARLSQDVPMSQLEERVEGMVALLQESQARLDSIEAMPHTNGAFEDSSSAAQETAAHVAELVRQLKEIVPKVIEHDRSIRQLASDVVATAAAREGQACAKVDTPASALDLDQGLSALREEIHRALEDLKWGDLQSQVGQQSIELLAAKDSLKNLSEQLNARAGVADTSVRPQQEEAVSGQLNDLRKELFDSVREQRYRAEENYKELAAELASLQRQGSLREEMHSEAAAHNQQLSASVKSLHDELASHKEQLSQHAMRAPAAEPSLQLQTSLDTLKEELGTLKASHSQVSASLQSARDELDRIQDSAAERSQLQSTWRSLQAEVDGLKSATAASAESQDAIRDIRRLVEEAPSVSSEDMRSLEREVQQIKAMAAAALDSQGAVKELKADVEAFKASAAATSALQSSVQEDLGKEAIGDLRRLVEGFQDQIAAIKAPDQEHQQLLDTLRVQLDSQLDGLKASAAETARLGSSFENLRSECFERFQNSAAETARVDISLESLKDELRKLRTSDTVVESFKEDLDGLKVSAAETEKLSSSLNSLRIDLEGLKTLAVDQPKSGDIQQQVAAEDTAKLISSVKSLQDELDSLRISATENAKLGPTLEKVTGDLESLRGQLPAIKDELAALQATAASAVDSQNAVKLLEADLGNFKQQVSSRAPDDQEVLRCSQRVDALIMATTKGGSGSLGDRELVREELEELANALKQDEEAEADAHKMILGRIDEVCRNLSEVSALGELQRRPEAAPEFAKKFDSLVQRVEEMQQVEQQMEARLTEFVSKTAPT